MHITLSAYSFFLLCAAAFALAAVVFTVAMNFMTDEKKIQQKVERLYSLEDPRFANELGVLLGPPFLQGNSARILLNGDQIFPAMLSAIQDATVSINFETFIYWSGAVGRQFADALSAAAQRGIKTKVLLDWIGSSKMDKTLLKEMAEAGVEIRRFHPPHWSNLGHMNNRTHRKLLVIDGRIGFTGGVGIAQEWSGHAQDPDHWRDTHVRIEGPIVAQVQSVFLDNWIKVTGQVLHGADYFPELRAKGDTAAQMFSSAPDGGSDSMQLMYLFAIVGASRTIDLAAAYFVPDALTQQALLDAIRRGVRLRVIVPGRHIDSETVRQASKAEWGPLLSAGATIAEYQPTMFHCKMMVIDQLLVSLGSTNFDNRSFRLNDEATLNILDARFAAEQTAIFERDLEKSRAISFEEWTKRPLREKLAEKVIRPIRSQL